MNIRNVHQILENTGRYVREYPFAPVTVASLLLFLVFLGFNREQLDETVFLLFGMVLIPLALQFLSELHQRKDTRDRLVVPVYVRTSNRSPAQSPGYISSPVLLRVSRKALYSFSISLLVFLTIAALPPGELARVQFQLGFFSLELFAFLLGVLAARNIRHQLVKGMGVAIADLLFAGFLMIGYFSWLRGYRVPGFPE
ncbi:MAG: hypothetical protein ACOC0U_07470 [Desulfovibrionales bacterium]